MIYNVPCFNLCRCVPMCQNHSRPVSITHIDIMILVSRKTLNFICSTSYLTVYYILFTVYLPPWKLCCFYTSPCHLQSCTPTLLPSQGITAQTALVPFESFQILSLKMLRRSKSAQPNCQHFPLFIADDDTQPLVETDAPITRTAVHLFAWLKIGRFAPRLPNHHYFQGFSRCSCFGCT